MILGGAAGIMPIASQGRWRVYRFKRLAIRDGATLIAGSAVHEKTVFHPSQI
jgi:hypothetical protein